MARAGHWPVAVRAAAVAVVAFLGSAVLGALAPAAQAGGIEVEPSTVEVDPFLAGDAFSALVYRRRPGRRTG